MVKHLTKLVGALVLIAAGNVNAAGVVEVFVQFATTDAASLVTASDKWFASNDSKAGQTTTIYAAAYDGANPATHLLLARFKDYASLQALDARRANSIAWRNYGRTWSAVTTPVASGLVTQRASYGSGGNADGYLAATAVKTTDAAKYAAAFDKMMKSSAIKAPGETRLMANRAGGTEFTHVVVMTAPNFVAMNEYLDAVYASDAYAKFAKEVAGIRTVEGTDFYRRVKGWTP